MNVFYEFWKIAKVFETEQIPYALVGGVAVAFHSVPRFTKDIDILVEPEVVERVSNVLKNEGYFESTSPRTFKNTVLTMHRFMKIVDGDEMLIDVLVSGSERHSEIIANAVDAESAEVKVKLASKDDLIWLKRFRNSIQDQADIEGLEDEES
jgi:hypothetical protein